MNDTTDSLAQKLLVDGRFASYELLKGAVNVNSARIGYGSKIVRADGKTRAEFACLVNKGCTFSVSASARSSKEPGVFRVTKKSCLTHTCDQLLHLGQAVQADKCALSRVLAGQLATQGTLPDASSIVSIAAQALDMPVKKAAAY